MNSPAATPQRKPITRVPVPASAPGDDDLATVRVIGGAPTNVAKPVVANHDTAKRSPFELQWFSGFKDEPAQQWLVRQLVVDGNTGVWAGHKGTMKSTALLGIALAVATGQPAFGNPDFAVSHPGPVAWIAGEDMSSVGPRIKAWQRQFGYESDPPIGRVQAIPHVTRDAEWEELCQQLDAKRQSWRLIVLDTVSTSVAGEDENSSRTMAGFVSRMADLAKRYRCTVLAAAHKSRATGARTLDTRGSTALLSNAESAVNLHVFHKGPNNQAKVVEISFERFKRKTGRVYQFAVKAHPVANLGDGTSEEATVLIHDPALAEAEKRRREAGEKQQREAREAAVAVEARTFTDHVLQALRWYSERQGDQPAPLKPVDLATMLARPDEWTERPDAELARVLDFTTLTTDQRKARDGALKKRASRLAKEWHASTDASLRALVPQDNVDGVGWTFDAHAAFKRPGAEAGTFAGTCPSDGNPDAVTESDEEGAE